MASNNMEVTVITGDAVRELDRIMTTNPKMRSVLKKLVSTVLQKARTQMSKEAKESMNNDPRAAYRAVKRAVYKRILGGSVNILSKRKAGSTRVKVERDRKLVDGQRGGNRRKRSKRTEQVDSYYGADRGFILRFINAGTNQRNIKVKGENNKNGNRGRITGNRWFKSSSKSVMDAASEEFCQMVDAEIEKALNANN